MDGDLAAFLAARLDEDEAAAKAAWGVEWDWRYVAEPFGERPSIAHTVHIARHDPARVLREVAAKRAILARYATVQAWSYPPGDGDEAVQDELGEVTRSLAAVYSDHPGYREEWKPTPAR